MRKWLAKFFTSIAGKLDPTPDPTYRLDVYDPGERLLFRFFTGMDDQGKKVFVEDDPMVLHKRLMDVGPELDADMTAAQVPESKFSKAGHDGMVAKIKTIFQVKEFKRGEVGGLTELELVDLLNQFFIYCGGVKKNSSPTVTSPTTTSPSTQQPTVDGSSESSSADLATLSPSASTSVDREIKTEGSTSSLKESPLPSEQPCPPSPTSRMSQTATVQP